MPRLKNSNSCQPTDRILPLMQAGIVLKAELAMPGWSRSAVKQKIAEGWRFRWQEGLHYLRSGRGIVSLNVDAIKREVLRC